MLCKKCNSETRSERYYKNHEESKKKGREYAFKYRDQRKVYKWASKGIVSSIEEYNQLLKSQKGVCAICKNPETTKFRGKLRHLALDHNHKNKKIRELLCYRCNITLGLIEEDTNLLLKMIKYLKKWKNK